MKIKTRNGTVGWIMKSYVRVDHNREAVPTVEATVPAEQSVQKNEEMPFVTEKTCFKGVEISDTTDEKGKHHFIIFKVNVLTNDWKVSGPVLLFVQLWTFPNEKGEAHAGFKWPDWFPMIVSPGGFTLNLTMSKKGLFLLLLLVIGIFGTLIFRFAYYNYKESYCIVESRPHFRATGVITQEQRNWVYDCEDNLGFSQTIRLMLTRPVDVSVISR